MDNTKSENLYHIGKHYESHYDDDDCDYLYYDAKSKSLCIREWTTRFACDSLSYPTTPIQKGFDNGDVTYPDLAKAIVEWLTKETALRGKVKNILESCLLEHVRYNMPCVVKGGRKYHGEAILIDMERKPYSIGYGRTCYQHVARLLTPEGGIAYATDCYVHVKLTEDEIVEKLRENILRKAEYAKDFCEGLFAYCGRGGGSFYAYRNYVYCCLFPLCHEYDEKVDKAIEADQKARENKHMQWLKDKRTGLLDWCRTTFNGKSEDEIQTICDRIMKKKYGETCVAV